METSYALAIIFAVLLSGALLRAAQPFLQKQQEREKTYEALRWIPESQLSEEQKAFIAQMGQPLHFRKYYSFTAIVGFIGVLTTALGGFALVIASFPENPTDLVVVVFAINSFLAAYGAVDIANRLQNSKSSEVAESNKKMVSEILAKKSDTPT